MKFTYGNGNTCELAREDVVTVSANTTMAIPENEISARVRQALANPLDYPDLASASVPGDSAVVAVEYGVPHVLQVIQGTLESLQLAGIEKSATTILLAPEFKDHSVALLPLRELIGEEVSLIVHSSEDDDNLALLGVTEAGRPLRLHRLLCDADLVVPISATNSRERLFPTFSDLATHRRFCSPLSHESAAARKKLDGEIDECHWMLGVNLIVQVVPGPRGEIAAVYSGTPSGVGRAAQENYAEVWSISLQKHAELIVATVVGDESQQTWQNIGRALVVANKLREPGGAVAICSDLADRPGASVRRLCDATDFHEIEKKLLRDEFADSAAALALCRSLDSGTTYLKSQLDHALVESLGLAPIQSDSEIERLSRTYRRCLVLEEAQYLEPKLVD